ncbi:MAG: NPCBM/NEW2 domain-containing protein [Pirellulales bacterium]|nr:NPCBM/NEW2 domain-containing protein [Pirellulales bacterium]
MQFKAQCDGSAQHYVLVDPKGSRADRPRDLLIVLHGHGSDRWQYVKDPRDECRAARDVAAAHGMLYVSPDYRAKTSWMGPKAEADLVQIIKELKSHRRIGKVFLCGASMGGSSVLTFAALHPELIDGVASMNGTANHLEYENFQEFIRESFGGTKTEIPTEYKKRSAEYWPERLTMPVAITAGGKDTVVPPQSVLRLAGALKKLQPNVLLIYREAEGHSTNYQDAKAAIEFIIEKATAKVAYLSDLLPERAMSITQGWGVLGVDTMVQATLRVPKPVRHLGELGIDTKVVPSDQPAPKLRIKDQEYAHGLGHHAHGEIVVNLSGQYKTFESEVGVQWMGGTSPGSVVFQVVVDGRKVFDSGVMRENHPPRPVKVSVEGADELKLIAHDAGDGITADCADWADARLTQNPALKNQSVPTADIAPFARVLSWDPKIMEGTKALRSDEFPAADLAPYQEILPSAEKTYAVPTADGQGCIGLQWDENRLLCRVELEFPDAASVPPPESIRLEFWNGESEWQGAWQPSATVPERNNNRLVWRLDVRDLPLGAQKVRWVFSHGKRLLVLKSLSAFTRSRWKTVAVRIEQAQPGPSTKAEIEVYNGMLVNPRPGSPYHCAWDGAKPISLTVLASARRPYKADRTVLRFQWPDTAFGVAVEDLLDHDCVYVPHANLFVTRIPSPVTPAEYLGKIAGKKSMLEEVRQRPDQDFRHACAVIHHPLQDRQSWVPMMISLACDNRKFLVYRDGSLVFNEYKHSDDYPGENDGIHTVAANIGQWRMVPGFGGGQGLQISRRLAGGWLPMPVTTVKDKNITYRQTTFIAPVGEAPAGKPVWYRDRALGVVEYAIINNDTKSADVRLSLQFVSAQDPNKPVKYHAVPEGIMVTTGDRVLAFIGGRNAAPPAWKIEPAGIVLSGTLSPGGAIPCTVYLPAWQAVPDDFAAIVKDTPWAPRLKSYWRSLLAPAMQIEIPDLLLDNLIRASQVHCLMAARNQEQSKYVVPWISSIFFAYLESEANSILRGMDMTGHPEFTRRGLEFYLKESNPAGFITILAHNKITGISCGYTLVGTGEILWTLGGHYLRTHDRAWLRKVAPDVVRICRWVIQQREKTKRLDARGRKVPGYGLAPPGVSADWNRFAYRFFNDAQYYHGLVNAGRALAEIGDPAAPAILEDAKNYRDDIIRAYHAMQAQMPVVPLKNGTWVPADPSLLGSYGNVEDFLPGEDENRTYVYSVELGANHLVANGVLDPNGPEARGITDYLEDVQFLRTRRETDPRNVNPFDWGGFAKMQPYYCRVADIHAQRDDVKPFIRSYFNVIPALVNFEDLSFWENMEGRGVGGAWNKTHETGWFLGQTRTMFVTERGDELWLAPFVPNQWLKDGLNVSVRNAPTRFGKVGYSITSSSAAAGHIDAVVQLPPQCPARKIVLRLRHPEGKPIRSVAVQGKPHTDFDPNQETVSFPPNAETITIRAEY